MPPGIHSIEVPRRGSRPPGRASTCRPRPSVGGREDHAAVHAGPSDQRGPVFRKRRSFPVARSSVSSSHDWGSYRKRDPSSLLNEAGRSVGDEPPHVPRRAPVEGHEGDRFTHELHRDEPGADRQADRGPTGSSGPSGRAGPPARGTSQSHAPDPSRLPTTTTRVASGGTKRAPRGSIPPRSMRRGRPGPDRHVIQAFLRAARGPSRHPATGPLPSRRRSGSHPARPAFGCG